MYRLEFYYPQGLSNQLGRRFEEKLCEMGEGCVLFSSISMALFLLSGILLLFFLWSHGDSVPKAESEIRAPATWLRTCYSNVCLSLVATCEMSPLSPRLCPCVFTFCIIPNSWTQSPHCKEL